MMHGMMKPIGAPAVPNNNAPNNGTNNFPGAGPMPPGSVDPNMPRKRYFGHRKFNNPMREYTIKSANLPLEEAAKLEVSRSSTVENNKTAVNILQEVLSRRNVNPLYEMLPVEGSLNEPFYQYRLTLESSTKQYVGIGGGKSKKEAKQKTARSVLNQLLGIKDDTPPPRKPGNKEDASKMNGVSNGANAANGSKVIVEPNPISLLQESCFARRWPPPYYETEAEAPGSSHERQFVTNVYVDRYKETGTAKTKKLAKREAAKRLLVVLKNVPVHPVDYKKLYDETVAQSNNLEKELSHLKEASYVKMTPQQSKKIAQFHQKLKNNKGPKLDALKQNISNMKGFDPVQYLHEISQEQRFEITFVEIEDKSLAGQFQALVQLATYPVAVCHGQGKTHQEAKTMAAHNAVEYLRLMTKTTK
uniref:Interferon-inducible double-stranded RNA-dependent protein kinase activator A homolog A n=1 Tax=Cacopsylla melanoneura TaxID=428564 RepID=A0A8D9BDV0_9HEMI